MDLSFPLRYQGAGVRTASTEQEIAEAHILHILNTYKNERIIYTDFGINPAILHNIGIPEVLAESIRLTLSVQARAKTTVEIQEYVNGKAKVRIQWQTISMEVSL